MNRRNWLSGAIAVVVGLLGYKPNPNLYVLGVSNLKPISKEKLNVADAIRANHIFLVPPGFKVIESTWIESLDKKTLFGKCVLEEIEWKLGNKISQLPYKVLLFQTVTYFNGIQTERTHHGRYLFNTI